MLLLYEISNLKNLDKSIVDKRLTVNFNGIIKNYGKQMNINNGHLEKIKAKMFKYYKELEEKSDSNNFFVRFVLTDDNCLKLITKDDYSDYTISDDLEITAEALDSLERTFPKCDG